MPTPGAAGPLVDAADLAALLARDGGDGGDGVDGGDGGVGGEGADGRNGRRPVVLDVRWTLAGADRGAYVAGHVPGAVFVDLDRDLAGPPGPGGRHPLPDPAALQAVWRRAGISEGSDVVVLDGGDGGAAARAWWLLRWSGVRSARILDGGWPAWERAGGTIETGEPPPPEPGDVVVEAGSMPTVDVDQAAVLAGDPSAVLLDARAPERYAGEQEPVDAVAGHVPGAANLPYRSLLTEDGRYRDPAALRRLLDDAWVRPGMQAAASCGSGVTACALVLAGELADRPLALWPGSWSEWSRAGRPVATGPHPGTPDPA